MKKRKPPIRKCVATQERLPKEELLRVVRNKSGEIAVDPSGKAHGRGAYIKRDRKALERAKKNRSLERALGAKVPESLYEDIARMLDE